MSARKRPTPWGPQLRSWIESLIAGERAPVVSETIVLQKARQALKTRDLSLVDDVVSALASSPRSTSPRHPRGEPLNESSRRFAWKPTLVAERVAALDHLTPPTDARVRVLSTGAVQASLVGVGTTESHGHGVRRLPAMLERLVA